MRTASFSSTVPEAIQPRFGPVRVMLGEHVDGRAFISAMTAAVSMDDAARFVDAATGYVALLRRHIDRKSRTDTYCSLSDWPRCLGP